jgi:hypothetical protein
LQGAGRDRWIAPLATAGAAAIGFLLVAWPAALMAVPAVITVPLALIGALAGAWLAAARALRRKLQTAVRADGAFLRPFTLTADGDGLVIESAVSRTQLAWVGVLSVDATPEQILLLTDGASAIVIPRSAFGDVAAMRAFCDHLRTLKREGAGGWGAVSVPRKTALQEPLL